MQEDAIPEFCRKQVLILGCGNLLFGDDGFGCALAEYLKAPEVTRRRIYLETMAEILPKLGKTVILDEQTKGLLPFVNVGELPSSHREERKP